jgi:hypothetical protein
LVDAESAVFLVGGYDGSGNYGDVLQLATAIQTVGQLPGAPLPVPIVECEMRPHHNELTRRRVESFAAAVFLFFGDGPDADDSDLAELRQGDGPARSMLYVYGGGHLNGWWGARKVAHATAAERLVGDRQLPLVASGLQVDEGAIRADGPAHELLSRASWIGVRDSHSRQYLRKHIPNADGRLELAGDDAVPFLKRQPAAARAAINLHVNDGVWVSEDSEETLRAVTGLVGELGAADGSFELQPVIAYEDPRVSERRLVSELLQQNGRKLGKAGLNLAEPVDVLDDAIGNGLARFGAARLTVSCSYHVALTSLLAGIPTVLFAENEYYEQKAAGLRDLFQLDERLIGVRSGEADASAAIEALVDGQARTALVEHLRTRSRHIVERFERGRAALSAALADGLRRSALEAELEAIRSRVETDEQHSEASAEPAAPMVIPSELVDAIGSVRALAEDGLARADHALAVAADISLPTRMLAFMSWLELQPPSTGPLVSVILATRNRPNLLTRAIESVLAQRYECWELVIIDDGSDPRTREVAVAVEDQRLHIVEGPRRGLGAARNAGLDRAGGEIVCYLDDDNVMHPAWLQAAAHVFAERKDVDVAYGVAVAEHRIPDDPSPYGWWPSFWQLPWARETLERENVADAGALAHRRGLEQARFDEALRTGEDWDLMFRLTTDREALAIPALSHAYAMKGADRMSKDRAHRAGLEEIARKHSSE